MSAKKVGITVGRMKPDDVESCVELRVAAHPESFLARLGPEVLREIFAAASTSPRCLAWVARGDEHVVGYAIGVLGAPREFWREVVRRRPRQVAWRMALALLRRPSLAADAIRRTAPLLGRVVRGVAEQGGEEVQSAARPPSGELLGLMVQPEAQSRGVGLALVRRFAEDVERRGATSLWLSTEEGNERANRFYARHGFELIGVECSPSGTRETRWRLGLPLREECEPVQTEKRQECRD